MKILKQIYDTNDPKKALNRAIRAECPGGNEAMDLVTYLHGMSSTRPDWVEAYNRAVAVVDAMTAWIERKYTPAVSTSPLLVAAREAQRKGGS